MNNNLLLKQARAIEVGDHILSSQCSTGIILANKVVSIEIIEDGKRVEIGTNEANGKRFYVVKAEDMVLTVT